MERWKDQGPDLWKEWREKMPQGKGFDFRGPKELEKWMPPGMKERLERWKDGDFDFRYKRGPSEEEKEKKPGKGDPKKDPPKKEKKRDKGEDGSF